MDNENNKDVILKLEETEEKHLLTSNDDQGPMYNSLHSSSPQAQHERRPSLKRRLSDGLLQKQDSLGQQITSYIPTNLVSNIPMLNRTTNQETYYCHICFRNESIAKVGFRLSDCEHVFCLECIKDYWTSKINDGQIQLKCFYPIENNNNNNNSVCGIKINEKDLQSILDNNIYEKYSKFKLNIENPNARQCPYCDTTSFKGNNNNIIIKCENNKCNKLYCFYHANAHDVINETCESYEAKKLKENKLNQLLLTTNNAKPCPGCSFMIEKESGCNHMKCIKCSTSFCWLCLSIIDNNPIPEHFKDPNSKCKGKQFEGMEAEPLSLPFMCLLAIFFIIVTIPSLILAYIIGTFIIYPIAYLCNCCIPKELQQQQQQFDDDIKPKYFYVIKNTFVAWILFFFIIIIALPLCIIFCLIQPIRLVLRVLCYK